MGALSSITLHRAAVDNAGLFVDAGNDLTVGDEAKAGVIDGTRAQEIVSSHGAAGHRATAEKAEPAPEPAPGPVKDESKSGDKPAKG